MSEATIHQLLGEAMAEIGAVAKSDRNQAQGFNFRGIDSVVNAVGPVLRKHRVVMLPEAGEPTIDHYETRNGARMAHVLLPVTFHFYGPQGDSVTCRVVGEAADAGDKVMSKAHSVAWRVALLECFAIPTDDPDLDGSSHERAPARDPEPDWQSLGWRNKTDHETTKADLRKRSKELDLDDQAALKAWLSDQGWQFPYSREQMDAWDSQIATFEVPGAWDDDDPGRPM